MYSTHGYKHIYSISYFTFAMIKGGFAHCYELIDVDTNAIYAGKIVPKSMLTKPHQREKVKNVACITVFAVFRADQIICFTDPAGLYWAIPFNEVTPLLRKIIRL